MAPPSCSVHFFFIVAPDFAHVHGFLRVHAREGFLSNQWSIFLILDRCIYTQYVLYVYFYSSFRCGSSLVITEHAIRDHGSKTADNLPHRATVRPLLRGHGIPECTQASYVMLQLWSRCKNDSAYEIKKTKQKQSNYRTPDVTRMFPTSVPGSRHQLAENEIYTRGEGEVRQERNWTSEGR